MGADDGESRHLSESQMPISLLEQAAPEAAEGGNVTVSTRAEQKRIVALGKILALAESICPTDDSDPLYAEILGIEARAQDSIAAIQYAIRQRRLRAEFDSLIASLAMGKE